jgi:hypothetical protein
MYDDLIKRLRASCDSCKLLDGYKCCLKGECTAQTSLQAADAIEELQKALNAVNDAHNEGYDVGYWAGRRDYEPKWIPVEERLPRMWEEVMLQFQNNQAVGFHDGGSGWAVFSGDNMYTYVAPEEVHPTHWMELPPAPKEE